MDEINTTDDDRVTFRWRLINIIVLGFAFMLMFTAFQTSSMIEQTVLESAKNDSNGTFQGSGYTSLAVIYATFASANWIAPSVVALCGAKVSMIFGGICYTLFIASFLHPMTWALYLGSVIVGVGAAIIWTGQGSFLTLNSDADTIGRNSGIFWALLQCSLLFGNLYIFFAFKGDVDGIPKDTRFNVYLVLMALCAGGVFLLLFLRNKYTRKADELNLNSGSENSSKEKVVEAFKDSWRLFITKEMLLLTICFAYTGLELTFFSGVYGTCVGHTKNFRDPKSLQGLMGVFIGVGEILGGMLFGLLGSRTNKFGRDPVIYFGFFVHTVCFYLIFINLPSESPFQPSGEETFLKTNEYVAAVCAFLLGLGDSSYNTQLYSLLGFLYPDKSAPAFALYKFFQSLAAAVGFFYSDQLELKWQLLILAVLNALGALSFMFVERGNRQPGVRNEGYTVIKDEDEDR